MQVIHSCPLDDLAYGGNEFWRLTDVDMSRVSAIQLYQIERSLTERDRTILSTLRQLRYMKTNQFQRLFYPQVIAKPYAAARATSRNLTRLYNLGLISHLPQRIGGVRAGSQGLIWHLTELGVRLLDLGTEREGKRKSQLEPSPTFLRHTIAVAEVYVQITEICRREASKRLDRLEVEPECWRSYERKGKPISLRPDLYAKIISGEYFDHLFIEVDLDTESVPIIVEKCRRYHEYYQTGQEQRAHGVFPLALWIVPTEERRQKMMVALKEAFGSRYPHIFHVIIPYELHSVLRDGAPEEAMV